MPTIESKFREHIINETSATVYMNRAPANATPPYIVQRLITKNDHTMGATQARVQFDVFGSDPGGYGQAKALSVDLTAAIKSFPDPAAVYRVSEMETFDDSVDYYRIIIDAMIYYDETLQFG